MFVFLQPASSLMMTQDFLAQPEFKKIYWWEESGVRKLRWLDSAKQEASIVRARLALSPLKFPYNLVKTLSPDTLQVEELIQDPTL